MTARFPLALCCAAFYGLVACSSPADKIVAQVYDAQLRVEDLQGMQPSYEVQDSFTLHPALLSAWIEKQALVHAARTALHGKEKNFDRELQNYYETLLVNAYENKEVERRLDRQVSEEEIRAYYNSHKADFEMHKNIVQINYAKFPIGHPSLPTVRKLLQKGKQRSEAEQEKLFRLCYQEAENMYLDFNWVVFDDILKEIPIETYNQAQFLQKNESLELTDSSSVYMVQFLDYKINETYSPLDLERDNISKIILRQRRNALLRQIRKEAVEKAYQEHEVTTEFKD